MGRKARVTVATFDGLEQVIILGQGAVRMSGPDAERRDSVGIGRAAGAVPGGDPGGRPSRSGSCLFDKLSEEEAQAVQDARLGRRELFEMSTKITRL